MSPESERRKFRKISQDGFGSTYRCGNVALNGAVMDLHIGAKVSKNSSTLGVAYPHRKEDQQKTLIRGWHAKASCRG
jgi:hypothetical protein